MLPEKLKDEIASIDVFIVLLTKGYLNDPRAMAQLDYALTRQVPIAILIDAAATDYIPLMRDYIYKKQGKIITEMTFTKDTLTMQTTALFKYIEDWANREHGTTNRPLIVKMEDEERDDVERFGNWRMRRLVPRIAARI
jgi:hypothetical protein